MVPKPQPYAVENWRPVVGYEGSYEVSDIGRIRRAGTGKPKTLRGRTDGYVQTDLYKLNERTTFVVHALVAAAFIGPRPPGMEVCHFNGVRTDNQLSNLRYDTHTENAYDRVRHGNHYQAVKTHCKWGHEFTSENTLHRGRQRQCRECGRRRAAEQRRRNGSAAVALRG